MFRKMKNCVSIGTVNTNFYNYIRPVQNFDPGHVSRKYLPSGFKNKTFCLKILNSLV